MISIVSSKIVYILMQGDAAYDEQSWTETTPLTEEEKASVLRQMIRANILSEV